MLEKLSASQRKLINWLGFVVIVGIGFLIIQPTTKQEHEQPKISTIMESDLNDSSMLYERQVEQRLAEVLTQIKGVGEVKVYATLERSSKITVAETINEEIRADESRTTSTPVFYRTDGGNTEKPLILEEQEPILRGVLIVCAGAEDPIIRYRVFKAAQTVLQLPLYRIEVLTKEN